MTTTQDIIPGLATSHARRPYTWLAEYAASRGRPCYVATHRSQAIECPACGGVGETCTNPANTDPQAVELAPCFLCHGKGEMTTRDIAEYDRWVREQTDAPAPAPSTTDAPPF